MTSEHTPESLRSLSVVLHEAERGRGFRIAAGSPAVTVSGADIIVIGADDVLKIELALFEFAEHLQGVRHTPGAVQSVADALGHLLKVSEPARQMTAGHNIRIDPLIVEQIQGMLYAFADNLKEEYEGADAI